MVFCDLVSCCSGSRVFWGGIGLVVWPVCFVVIGCFVSGGADR